MYMYSASTVHLCAVVCLVLSLRVSHHSARVVLMEYGYEPSISSATQSKLNFGMYSCVACIPISLKCKLSEFNHTRADKTIDLFSIVRDACVA